MIDTNTSRPAAPGAPTLPRARHLAAAAAALALAACGGDDHDHDHVHDHGHGDSLEAVEGHMCEHFQSGPFEMVTATGEATGAPSATFEHTRVNVSLPAGAGGMNEGWIHMDSEAPGEVLIGFSQDVPVEYRHDGGAVAPERSMMGTACGELVMLHVLDVHMGRYDIRIGPTSEDTIGFGFEALGGHDHGGDHDHDHDDDHGG